MPFPSKHLIKPLSASVRINGFSASGSSGTVTTPLSTALSTAGEGSTSVPVQAVGGSNTIGVVVASPNNRVEVYSATTKRKIANANGDEVYARLTEATGVYTLSYFVLPASGTETAFTFASATNIDFEFNYRFSFDRLPADAIVSTRARNVSDDPAAIAGGGLTPRDEFLTVTALNTVSGLSFVPSGTAIVELVVNGESFDSFGGANAPFSVSGQAIIWNAVNARMPLETTDRVVARYFSA